MIEWAQAAAWLPLAWASVVASVSLEAARRSWVTASRPSERREVDGTLRVLIVRPCAGREPHLERTLGSLREARSAASLRCVFAVESERDGAAPAAGEAAAALSAAGIPARLAITGQSGRAPGSAPNRKAAQIAAVMAGERDPFDVVLIADSDVDLAGLDLDAMLSPLRGPGAAAAVWAPPAERAAPRTLGDRASAAILGGSLHSFPLLATLDPGGLVGKLCAIDAEALGCAGGFDALAAHLGEDMELARRLRAQGGSIRVAPVIAPSLASGRAARDVIARYARWITVIRAQRPLLLPSYPGLFCATPLIAALALLAALIAPAPALAALGVALAARLFTAAAAARAAGRSISLAGAALDALLADLLLLVAFARAVTTRRVVWRSAVLTVDRRGLLRGAEA